MACFGKVREEEDSTYAARSIAWELIPYIALWAGEGCEPQLSYNMTHIIVKPALSSQHLKKIGQYASSPCLLYTSDAADE